MNNMIKTLLAVVAAAGLTACGKDSEKTAASSTGTVSKSEPIVVVSREMGSGTRSAFVDIVKIVDDKGNDAITINADTLNGTSGVIKTVEGNAAAIGYISYGSLNKSVKAVAINGVTISADAISKGEYKIARPFNLVWKEATSNIITPDFLAFIFSQEGQGIIEKSGYISVVKRGPYRITNLKGQLNIVGSTSVTPVIEKLAEAYMKLNPGVRINITSNGSTAGATAAMDGTADLGMVSRALKDKEKAKLVSAAIAQDGIAVIVNNQSKVDNLSFEEVRDIYKGKITDWTAISKNNGTASKSSSYSYSY